MYSCLLATIGKTSITYDEKNVKIMGIVNLSPESFYRNSIKLKENEIQDTVIEMENSGVDIIDVGGMSTAPYLNTLIPADVEQKRLFEAISAIRQISDIPISVDTMRSSVVRGLLNLDINAINDVTGLKYDKKMPKLAFENNLPVIICSYASETEQYSIFGDIQDTLSLIGSSIRIAQAFNIKTENLIIDPSIGFFRNTGNNPFYSRIKGLDWYVRDMEIISNFQKLKFLRMPICVSISRKSFLKSLFNLDAEERLIPSIIAEMHCAINGASLLRTHNVKETRQALDMMELLYKNK